MSKAKIEIRADIPVVVFPCGGCRPCGHAEYEIIKELEAEKAELLEFIRYMYYNVGLDENEEKKFDTILQKYKGE